RMNLNPIHASRLSGSERSGVAFFRFRHPNAQIVTRVRKGNEFFSVLCPACLFKTNTGQHLPDLRVQALIISNRR
ncbi:MAG: hypothetical protein KDC61_15925, partial [Saprospiraceae bacterium]|nr:hypothetical protein [Saprospiraceae bacterium]